MRSRLTQTVKRPRGRHSLTAQDIVIAESTTRAFMLIDHAQRICFVSVMAEKLLNAKAQHFLNKPWFSVLTHEAAPSVNPVRDVLQKQKPVHISGLFKNTDPQRLFVAEAQWLRTPAKRPLVHLSFTEAKLPALKASAPLAVNDERELNHLLRLNTVGELATSIAHELNQPLSAILSYSQAATRLLHDEEPNWDLAANATLNAADQARRAGAILQQLRNFVGKGDSKPELLSINRCIRNSLTLLAESIENAQVQLILRTQPCPPVLADAIHIEQVLVNLIQNAIDALRNTAGVKHITVSSHSEKGMVKICIQDNGPGIAANDQEHIFDRFFTTKPDGMGLGLNICQRIITSAGGELQAMSPHAGGALFQICLPAIIDAKELQHAEPIT